MDKAAILALLTSSGEINRFSHTQNWDKAFKLFNEANPNDKKSPRCGTCYKHVLRWLQH